jgi:hypothetical protein
LASRTDAAARNIGGGDSGDDDGSGGDGADGNRRGNVGGDSGGGGGSDRGNGRGSSDGGGNGRGTPFPPTSEPAGSSSTAPPPKRARKAPVPREAQAPAAATTTLSITVPSDSTIFGPERNNPSLYWGRYLSPEPEQQLIAFCRDEVRYQIYRCTSMKQIKGGERRLIAPKAEFYLLDGEGRRPHYKWTQVNDFDHAGLLMPPILAAFCEQFNTHFGLTGDNRLNHCIIIGNEGTPTDDAVPADDDAVPTDHDAVSHHAPGHADKIQKGFFLDLSLGHPRVMNLLDAQSKTVVASQKLASGSLAFISPGDNGRLVQGKQRAKGESKVEGTRYLHQVPREPNQSLDQPRFSLVFRPITDHPTGSKCGEHLAKVDEEKAARVRPGGDLWEEYIPRFRRYNGD